MAQHTYSLVKQDGTVVATGNRETITENVALQRNNQGDLCHWRDDGRIVGVYVWTGDEYDYHHIQDR